MRTLFLLTMALYGFSAMDLHEWVRVPQVVMHLLEHHSDLGHNDDVTGEHHNHKDHDDPFAEDCHGEFCACSGLVALSPVNGSLRISIACITTVVSAHVLDVAPCGFAGNVWNPPKA